MEIFEQFLILSSLFFLGGVCGWVIELFFRRFFSQKRWVNPGFLTGPMLPLYGFGLVGFYVFANYIPWASLGLEPWAYNLIATLVVGVAMTLIEYIAGLIFIIGLKVKLWDYSNQPGNIQGIICPLFSFFWLVIGALYIYFCNPGFLSIAQIVKDNLLVFGFFIGLGYGFILIDFGWSLGLLTKIRKAVKDSKLVVSWENIKISIQDHYRKVQESHPWIFAFKTKKEEFSALIDEYIAGLKEYNAHRLEEKKYRAELKKNKKK